MNSICLGALMSANNFIIYQTLHPVIQYPNIYRQNQTYSIIKQTILACFRALKILNIKIASLVPTVRRFCWDICKKCIELIMGLIQLHQTIQTRIQIKIQIQIKIFIQIFIKISRLMLILIPPLLRLSFRFRFLFRS